MTTIPQLSHAMQTLLTTTTEAVAADLHFVQRPDRAKFSPQTLVQTLVYGWLANPTASLEQLAQMAARLGIDVSPQAIHRRFTMATATLLHHVLTASLSHVIAADPVAIPILQRFASVRIHDSTTISLPDALASQYRGCGNHGLVGTAGMKCGVQIDVLTGALCGVDIVDGRACDHALPVQHAAMPSGSLRLADLGFYNLSVLKTLAENGVFWLSRIQTNSRIRLPGQRETSILEVVTALGTADQWEGTVLVGRHGRLTARLLIQRLPPQVAAQRRQRVEDEAHGKRRPVSKDAVALSAWAMVITNVSRDQLSLSEALVLLKIRWQIELLFKMWKSHGRVDEWRTTKPARILCEIYAKLIGFVVHQWFAVVGTWSNPTRSMMKAATIVMTYAAELATAHHCPTTFLRIVTTVVQMLRRWARTNTRKTVPTTAQRLLALTIDTG
ncbi:IS4 family transposase [Herpetosiphon llansteffanensis]